MKSMDSFHIGDAKLLRNRKSKNYKELVQDLLLHLRTLECNMSTNLYFLHSNIHKQVSRKFMKLERKVGRAYVSRFTRRRGMLPGFLGQEYYDRLLLPLSTPFFVSPKRRALKRSFLEHNERMNYCFLVNTAVPKPYKMELTKKLMIYL